MFRKLQVLVMVVCFLLGMSSQSVFGAVVAPKPLGVKAAPLISVAPKGVVKPAPMAQITALSVAKSSLPGFPYECTFSIKNSGVLPLVGFLVKPHVVTKMGQSYLLATINYQQLQIPPGQTANGKEPFKLLNVPEKAWPDINAFNLEVWYNGKKLAAKKVPFVVKVSPKRTAAVASPAAQAGATVNGVATMQPGANLKPQLPAHLVDKKPSLLAAELSNLQVGTESDGRWYWKARVTNKGTETIANNLLTAQGIQSGFGRSSTKPASGSIMPSNIAPNQSIEVKRYWTRCCRTQELNVELKRTQSSQVFGAESVTGLISTPGNVFGSKLKIKNITWNTAQQSWQVTIQNTTPYSVKLVVQGYRSPGGVGAFQAAGGVRVTAAANAMTTTLPVVQSGMQDGDKLKVALIFDVPADFCDDWETPRDCGAERGNITTIPESADFQ